MSKRKFVMSDLHGHYHPARALLEHANVDLKGGDSLRFLGDYIDRGPHSYECMKLVQKYQRQGAIAHIGNHELMFLMYTGGSIDAATYFLNGGKETLDSMLKADIDQNELEQILHWMSHLKVQDYDDEYVYVHAGINPNKSLEKQTNNDMLWIREEFLNGRPEWIAEAADNRIVVHGHTPMVDVCFDGVKINTDVGAGGRKKLALIELNERIAYVYDFEQARLNGKEYAIKEVDIKDGSPEQLYKE